MMYRRISFFLAAVLVLVIGADAFGVKRVSYSELPKEYDGSMSGVSLENSDNFFNIPDSLTVTTGAYMSRHGARYLSSEKKITSLEKWIAEARAAGTLTRRGERFARLVQEVRDSNEGRWGLLSAEGFAEQQVFGKCFANRVLSRFDNASDGYVEQSAVSSFVPRVVETMYSFNASTLINFPHTVINNSEGSEYDNLTRFFVSDKEYRDYLENGDWQSVYDDFVKHNITGESARLLLGDIPGKDDGFYRKFTLHAYGMLQSLRVTGLGAPTTEWMSEEEYRNCWRAANLDMYLKRSLNSLSHIACTAAVPLLGYLLQSEPGEVTEVFGHAETLLPLVALMGTPDGVYTCDDFDTLSEHWRNYAIAPLGSNVAILTLKSKQSGKDYMMVFLNGCAVSAMPGSGNVVPADEYHLFLKNRVSSFTSGTRARRSTAR